MGRNTSRTNSQIGGQPTTSSSSKLFAYFYAAENTPPGDVMQSTSRARERARAASTRTDVNLFREFFHVRGATILVHSQFKMADFWEILRHL